MLEGAVVLIVGDALALDFLILQLLSSHCTVYVTARQHETASFQRAKTRIPSASLHYLFDSDDENDHEDEEEDGQEFERIRRFADRESRLDLVIFSSVNDEEQTIKYIVPTLAATCKTYGSADVIIMKPVNKRPRTRMDSLKHAKCHGSDDRVEPDDHNQIGDEVKAKIKRLFQAHDVNNVFVNTTTPDQLLPVVLQYDAYRGSHGQNARVKSAAPSPAPVITSPL
ncbi:hypothetical protein V1514DRAFT_330726 [Lipomyces japonicus]|uniref:uncharacterized protein n=1 Tax=Lipomyces japonicus TaxID=56871 RepID=UPI0034CFBA46